MLKPSGIISLLTDVGHSDAYAACIYGTILRNCRKALIINLTHEIPSFDIEKASLLLRLSYKFFPEGTIFVAVVVPGVGKHVESILIETKHYYFVGPNNGVLANAALSDTIKKIYLLKNKNYFRNPLSLTFIGRDIFASVSSYLACGVPPHKFGSEISVDELATHAPIHFLKASEGCSEVKIIHIDKYGNLMLSCEFNEISDALSLGQGKKVRITHEHKRSFSLNALVDKDFSHKPKGELLLYKNSFGYAELAVNQGSAKKLINAEINDSIKVCKANSS